MIDVGTGVIPLGRKLMAGLVRQGRRRGADFLVPRTWDHIQGFPFFPPVFVPGNKFIVHGPGRSPSMLEGILEGQMNPHFSPLYTMRNLGASIEVVAVDGAAQRSQLRMRGVHVMARLNPHGATQALAYRSKRTGARWSMRADAGYPTWGPRADVTCALSRCADVLIHDCTYSPEDRAQRMARGFSSNRGSGAGGGRGRREEAGHVPLRPGLQRTTSSTRSGASRGACSMSRRQADRARRRARRLDAHGLIADARARWSGRRGRAGRSIRAVARGGDGTTRRVEPRARCAACRARDGERAARSRRPRGRCRRVRDRGAPARALQLSQEPSRVVAFGRGVRGARDRDVARASGMTTRSWRA